MVGLVVLLAFLYSCFCALGAAWLADKRGRSVLWHATAGFLFGFLGVLLAGLMTPVRPPARRHAAYARR